LRFTVAEIADMTAYSVRTIRRHIAAGRLHTVRRGGLVFITPQDARVWLGHDLCLWKTSKPSAATYWRFVSIRLYAVIAGLTPRAARHQVDKGAIETVRVNGRVFVAGAEVDRLLSESDTKNT
jgi:hypothetical protein